MKLLKSVGLVCTASAVAGRASGLAVRGQQTQFPEGQALNSLLMTLFNRAPYNTSAGQMSRVTPAPQLAIHLSKARFDDSISQSSATPFVDKAQESIDQYASELEQIRSARRRVADKLDSLYAYEIPTIPGEQGRLKDYLRNPPFLTRYGPTYKTTQANPEHFTDIGADKREMSPIALLRQKEPSEAAGVREDVEGSTVVLERGDYASPTDLLALESLSEN